MVKKTTKKVIAKRGIVFDGQKTIEEMKAMGSELHFSDNQPPRREDQEDLLIDPELIQANALVEKLMVSADLSKKQSLDVVSVLNNMA